MVYQILIFITNGKTYKAHTITIKFKISASTWNDKFELPGGSYYVVDIQNYFEYILKKHEKTTSNSSIRIYVNKIEKIITFKKLDIIFSF